MIATLYYPDLSSEGVGPVALRGVWAQTFWLLKQRFQ
jgi:hypothetical protein